MNCGYKEELMEWNDSNGSLWIRLRQEPHRLSRFIVIRSKRTDFIGIAEFSAPRARGRRVP